MRLGELASVKHWLPHHATSGDVFWKRDSAKVSDLDIQMFYARMGLKRKRQEAIDAIDALQTAVILAAINGELPEVPTAIILHETPPEPFLVDELVDGLAKLTQARRQAVLFSLEMHLTPAETAGLTWRGMGSMKLTSLGWEILTTAGQTRHLKLPYVFWEWATPNIATPLLELSWSTHKAFDCTWPELAGRYKRMIGLSRTADAASLLELVGSRQ